MPRILLTENSKVLLRLSTIFLIIGSTITTVFAITSWKTTTEAKTTALVLQDTLLLERISRVENEAKERDKEILEQVDVWGEMSATNNGYLIELKTDVKWIINDLKDK